MAKLKEWQKTHPELFVKKVYNQSRPDTPPLPVFWDDPADAQSS
jgi:hypothetical protein